MDRQIEMLIFDMDGVILDSEPLHQNAREMMYKKYGILPDDSFPDPVGKSSSGFWDMVGEKYNRDWDGVEMEAEQYDLVARQVKDNQIPPTKGLTFVLEWGKKKGLKIGLASSSSRALVDRILELLQITSYFDAVVCGDEAPHKKPEPDIYEKVLQLADVKARNAVAVEDSSTGVEAAQRAGVFCYGYVNPTSGEQDLSRADQMIEDLEEICF